jgi:hypothetical protein
MSTAAQDMKLILADDFKLALPSTFLSRGLSSAVVKHTTFQKTRQPS